MNNKHFNYTQLAVLVGFLCFSANFVDLFAQTSKIKKTPPKNIKKIIKVQPVNSFFEDIQTKVRRIAREEGVNLRLFESLISQESAGRMTAVSYKGAKCLTQLMPATAQRYGLIVNSVQDERLNVDKCLRVGARYLRLQLDTFKDFRLALAAYNAGEGAVIKYGRRIPPYKETIQYVERIGYRFTGQIGHGTAFAWNLPVAVNYSRQAYGGRVDFRRVIPVNQSAVMMNNNLALSRQSSESISAVVEEAVKEENPLVKRTKVILEDPPARVPAASLFFWVKPNAKPSPE